MRMAQVSATGRPELRHVVYQPWDGCEHALLGVAEFA